MNKLNYTGLWIIFGVVFISILYKIIHIPITHDECATTLYYFNYSAWEIMMYPDNWPNNHILNTLWTKFFIILFGKEQWVVRLPNLLSFIGYVVAAYFIIRLQFKRNSVLILAAVFLFIGNSYLLDFFSLCRGYGMGSAMATTSVCFLMYGFNKNRDTHIWLACVMAILASYANFTLLVFWITITGLCGIYFLHKYWGLLSQVLKRLGVLAIVSVGYFALIITPLHKMTSTNQFVYWTSKGFYRDTLYSLAENWRYTDGFPKWISSDALVISVLILLFISIAVIIWRFIKTGWSWDNFKRPITIAFLSLCLTVTVNIIQCAITNTPNLSGRTALFFYPLFSILLVSLLAEIDDFNNKIVTYFLAIAIPGIVIWYMISTYNPRSVKEWNYDENTLEVIEYLKDSSADSKEKITLCTNWYFHPSFTFYHHTGKTPWLTLYPYNKNINKETDVEYYYIMESDLELLTPEFKRVKNFGNGRLLVKRQ